MSEPQKSFFDWIDIIAEKSAKITCYLVFIIMVITTADVIARYVFNRPLIWGWLLNRQLFGVFILFAGVYTLFKGEHIRIEILYPLYLICFVVAHNPGTNQSLEIKSFFDFI